MKCGRIAAGLLLSAAFIGAGTFAGPAQASPPSAQLTKFSCVRARDPLLRGVTVTAVMRSIAAPQRFQIRFDLLKATHRFGHYRAVRGQNLGVWLSPSDFGLGQEPADTWQLSHPVVGLSAPAYYRLRASFRWVGAGNHVFAHQVLSSPLCHQLELRPDLTAEMPLAPTAVPDATGEDQYPVQVVNRGASGVGPFDVRLSVGGVVEATQTINWLHAYTTRSLSFTAPACTSGQTVTVTVDPNEQVDDFARANNTVTVPCPAPAS